MQSALPATQNVRRGAVTGSPVTVRADVTEFRRLFDKSSQVEAKLRTALRRNIRQAAGGAADAVRAEVGQGTLRSGIGAGVKVKVMTGTRAGVTIVASSSRMPAGKQSLVRAWTGRKGWRHPVYGTGSWVRQVGNPGFFDRPITARKPQIRAAVEAAMTEAAQSLKGI